MKLFPSDNEKIIAAVLLAVASGLLVGLLVNVGEQDSKTLVGALVTLGAAFLGATVAFLLENRSKKRKERAIQLEAANSLLYMLYERLNCLKIFQKDHIDPHLESAGRMVEIRPIPNFRSSKTTFSASAVAFLFNTKYKNIMFELHVVEEVFSESIDLINRRNDLHINVYQRGIEARGYNAGDALTDHDVLAAIGPMNYQFLEKTTDNMINMVDRYVVEANELRAKLINVFSEFFSKEEVFAFELREE